YINDTDNENTNNDSYIDDVDDNWSTNDDSDNDTGGSNINDDGKEDAIDKLRWFYNDLENLLEQNDHALNSGVQKFVKVYKQHRNMQNTYILPAVALFLQTCGWEASWVNGSIFKQGGKKIRVQVAAASRHKVGLNRGLNKVHQGRPINNSKVNTEMQEPNRSIMPA
ncbi:hypothetical protein C2G38_2220629, partial [Gigaspora rosea]